MRHLLLSLCLLALPAGAEIYSYVDGQGNRVFTDRPPQNQPQAKSLALHPTNGMQAPPPPIPEQVQPPKETTAGYRWLRIASPEPDFTLRDGEGNLTVTAESEPALQPGHRFRLLLDGQPTDQTGSAPLFSLTNLDRGTHRLAVEILDADGPPLERSPEQEVHVKRPSLAQKRLVRPCQQNDYGVRPECPLSDKSAEKSDIPYVPFI